MNKIFFTISLGMLAAAGVVWPSRGDVTAMKALHGHVPPVVNRLPKTGDLPGTNDMHLAIGLQARNQTALDDMVRQVSDPASPNYRHFLSRDEFTSQFAPTEADYQSVIDFVQAHGLTVKNTSSNRMLIEVTGKAADVQNAFSLALHTYRHPTENRTFYAPDREPSVPANLPILDISGLSDYGRPHNHLRLRPNATNAPSNLAHNTGSGIGGSYMGNDFRAAYVPTASQTGSGQKVALVQFDGYFPSDIQTYESLNGLPNVALTNILLNGFTGVPTLTGGEVEVSLDIEMVISMAYGVKEVLLYEGNPDPAFFLPNVVLNQIAMDDSANQVSSSWSWTGGPNATTDQIFKEMILQGQTYFNAAGDEDAFLPGEADDPDLTHYPSSDPYITQVGGTTLTTTGPGGSYVSETVWNWDVEYGPIADGEGTCGGVSSYYTIPYWQTNVSMIANAGSTTYRNIPDVALCGDNVLVIADDGVYYPGTGGTSCAAPLWAAFTALINEQGASLGRGSVGFLNPTLYALANGAYYTTVFNDITTGSNTWSQSPTKYIAVTNYDLCTGLGTPTAGLIGALNSPTNVPLSFLSGLIPAPQPPWGTTLSVMDGVNPNGLWLLYYRDISQLYGGTNYNGWAVNLTTANPVGFAGDNELYVNTTINSTPYGNDTNVNATPGSFWYTTLAVTNYGPSLSSNVFVTDTLPGPGVILVSSNTSLGSITNFGSTLVWAPGNLAVNAGGALNLTFQASSAGLYTNAATVSAFTTDPNPDDDSIMVIATVAPLPPPAISPLLTHNGSHALELSITNDSGDSVIIQASTNLLTWLPVWTNMAPFTFTNFDTTNYSKRFYRAVLGQ